MFSMQVSGREESLREVPMVLSLSNCRICEYCDYNNIDSLYLQTTHKSALQEWRMKIRKQGYLHCESQYQSLKQILQIPVIQYFLQIIIVNPMYQPHVHTNIQETHLNYYNPNYHSYRPSTPQPTLLDSLKLKYSRNHPSTQHSITHRHDQYRSEVSLLKNRYSTSNNCSYKQNSNQHTLRQYRENHNQGSQNCKEKYQEKAQKGHSTQRNNTRESYESWSKVNPNYNCERKEVAVAMESTALRKMVEMKIGDRKAPKLVIKDKPIKKCSQNSYRQEDLSVLVRKLDSPIKLIDEGHRDKNTNQQMNEGDTVLKEVKQNQRENRKEKNTVYKTVRGDTLGQQMVQEVREARDRAEKERNQAVDKIIRNEVTERQTRDRQEDSNNTHRRIQAQMRSEKYSTDRTIASIDNILASIRNTLRQ